MNCHLTKHKMFKIFIWLRLIMPIEFIAIHNSSINKKTPLCDVQYKGMTTLIK